MAYEPMDGRPDLVRDTLTGQVKSVEEVQKQPDMRAVKAAERIAVAMERCALALEGIQKALTVDKEKLLKLFRLIRGG